ncbi:hypothetical protein EPI10_001369 [Gossypium australe]|uniref:Uncharacterized protein n=1 Tax=Gossypium australe TaxID=47621 RepID=A0A5B6VAW1_9ROSI|nr:hypothetical protein EPI10_001369 [Gossypium australe]
MFSESRASGFVRFIITYNESRMEMGASHDRFCIGFAPIVKKITRYATIHYFCLRYEIYLQVLGKITRNPEYKIEFQYIIPSLKRQTIRIGDSNT